MTSAVKMARLLAEARGSLLERALEKRAKDGGHGSGIVYEAVQEARRMAEAKGSRLDRALKKRAKNGTRAKN